MAVHAGRAVFEEGIGDRRGNAQAGTLVTVYERGTSTLATLYTDRTKATEEDNPTSTNALGNVAIYADPGDYEAHIETTGAVLYFSVLPDWEDLLGAVGDASDLLVAVTAALAAMQAEIDEHVATPHGHPDLADHLALGLDAAD